MITYFHPDALRAARALARLTHRDVEDQLGMSRNTLRACETGDNPTMQSALALRTFYDTLGIELLGTASFASDLAFDAGARWKCPAAWDNAEEGWHWEPSPWAFAAARALCGLTLEAVAEGVHHLTPRQVGNIEADGPSTQQSRRDLLEFYERKKGVEFFAHEIAGRFFGAGVRWSPHYRRIDLFPSPPLRPSPED